MPVHCKKDPYDVYIGRPSKWGNPFTIGKDGDREEVIKKYKDWLLTQPELLNDLPELQGKVLGCWCSPKPCHGDVLETLLTRNIMSEARGFVEVVTSKTNVNGKQLRSPLYSFKIGDDWYNCGFKNPNIEKGDTITFDFTEGQYGKDVTVESIKKAEQAVSRSASGATRQAPVGDRQTSIVWQNQHGQAVAAVNFMVEQGIIKLPAKQADKYEVYMDLIREVAVQWTVDALDPELEAPADTTVATTDDDE